jgi:hypothetical protein
MKKLIFILGCLAATVCHATAAGTVTLSSHLRGTVLALAPVRAIIGSRTVNVMDSPYLAACNGMTDDSAAFAAACNAVAAYTVGTVLIPGPMKLVTPYTTPVGYQGHIAIRGTSGSSSILLGANITYPITFDLSAGPNNGALNVAELTDLGFNSNGFTANGAALISYGQIPSSENNAGPTVRSLTIQGGGFTNGVVLNNVWHARVGQLYGYGSPATYDSGAGPGSGSLIAFTGQCVNDTVAVVQCDFWHSTISAVAGATQTFQGIEISQVNAVQSPFAFLFDGLAGEGCGAIQIVNCQVDNGNNTKQSHGYAIWARSVENIDVSNFYAVTSSAENTPFMLQQCGGVVLDEGKCLCGIGPAPVGCSFIDCGGCVVQNVTFTGFVNEVILDAQCTGCAVHDCRTWGRTYLTPIDLGSDDSVGDSRGLSAVWRLAGGKSSETFYLDISNCSLGKRPAGVAVTLSSDLSYQAHFDFDNPNNSPTQAAVVVWLPGSTTHAGDGIRVTAVCSP